MKASPEAPASAYFMADIMREVGLPDGVLNLITADREDSELLAHHPDIDKITFTGSSAVGKRIGSIRGSRLTRWTLELGSNAPGTVLDNYDPQLVALPFAQTPPILSGQVCASLTRIVATRTKHDALLEALGEFFSRIVVGDPLDRAVYMGPLAMRCQHDRVEEYIAEGEQEGAKLVYRGRSPNHLNRGFFIEPTVFWNVDNNMTTAREEIFGPFISVISADADRALNIARQMRTGTVGHNSFRSDLTIAFGGYKQSGMGREGGWKALSPSLRPRRSFSTRSPGRGTRPLEILAWNINRRRG